ncbi:MAG: hypothetical protein JWO25_226 [Alphaproteobacteria bacterium]|nr:hypothetical protein [Alphaproteobacteria bacterium]
MQDLARGEGRVLKVEHGPHNVSDSPSLFMGWKTPSWSAIAGSCMGVRMTPGATAFTRMPRLAIQRQLSGKAEITVNGLKR